jgi:hypothetical protein
MGLHRELGGRGWDFVEDDFGGITRRVGNRNVEKRGIGFRRDTGSKNRQAKEKVGVLESDEDAGKSNCRIGLMVKFGVGWKCRKKRLQDQTVSFLMAKNCDKR